MDAIALPAADSQGLKRQLGRAERRRKLWAFALTVPLLVFLLLTFLVPIAALLGRAVENPEIATALPRTVVVLADWDRRDLPPSPSTSPGAMSNDTSSTASRVPRRVGNSTRRFFTSSSGGLLEAMVMTALPSS